MAAVKNHRKIFTNGSTTYSSASLFFPKSIRHDVYKLYSFVRIADDLVDMIPQKAEEFFAYKESYYLARSNEKKSTNFVINDFVALQEKYEFDQLWIDAFFEAMQQDLKNTQCETLDDTLAYMYGSAEVVGLMMCKIMTIDEAAYTHAQMLGRAMQYINFIRDIDEDNTLNRQYLPIKDMHAHELISLSIYEAKKKPVQFSNFMHQQIERYFFWESQAHDGFDFLPKRCRIPVKTATDMYHWTAEQIRQNPLIVFEKKVKPKKSFIYKTLLSHLLHA